MGREPGASVQRVQVLFDVPLKQPETKADGEARPSCPKLKAEKDHVLICCLGFDRKV